MFIGGFPRYTQTHTLSLSLSSSKIFLSSLLSLHYFRSDNVLAISWKLQTDYLRFYIFRSKFMLTRLDWISTEQSRFGSYWPFSNKFYKSRTRTCSCTRYWRTKRVAHVSSRSIRYQNQESEGIRAASAHSRVHSSDVNSECASPYFAYSLTGQTDERACKMRREASQIVITSTF